MNIVIVANFGPPALACIRNYGRHGFNVGMVWIYRSKEPKPRSKYLSNFVSLPNLKTYTQEGISLICNYLDEFNADILICINEKIAGWLDENKSLFNPKVKFAIPSSRIIHRILSKTFQNKIARQVGLTTLPEYLIHSKNINSISIPTKHFPLCLRPSQPEQTLPFFKVELINSLNELRSFLKTLYIKKNGQIIAQPYKNLPNLVVHGIRTISGETKRFSSFIVNRKFEGVTLTLEPYPDDDGNFIEKCSEFVKAADLIGHFHFEFLFNPETNERFFLELNHRFGGTTAKVLACGYNEPLYALEAYDLIHINRQPEIKNLIVSNKQAILKYMTHGLVGKLSVLDFPDASVLKKIFAGISGLILFSDDVICRDDLKGSINLYMSNIIQKIGKGF